MYEFSFIDFLCHLKQQSKKVLLFSVASSILGVIIAFSIPKVYLSRVRLAAESNKPSALSGSMGSLASLAGINTNLSQDAISVELYPVVISSNKFLIDLMYVPVTTKAGKSYPTYIDYTITESKSTWWSAAIKGTIKIIKTLASNNASTSFDPTKKINPNQLSVQEEALVDQLRHSIECKIDDKTDVISLSMYSQDPLVSKMMVEAARVKLQDFIINYRTNKARIDLNYYQKLEKQNYQRYQTAQKKYSSYADAHTDVSLKSYSTKETDLENEMQMAYNAYAQMKTQVGICEGKVQEQTPAFTTVEDAYVANKAHSPKKILIILAFTFLGAVFTIFYIYARFLFSTPKQ